MWTCAESYRIHSNAGVLMSGWLSLKKTVCDVWAEHFFKRIVPDVQCCQALTATLSIANAESFQTRPSAVRPAPGGLLRLLLRYFAFARRRGFWQQGIGPGLGHFAGVFCRFAFHGGSGLGSGGAGDFVGTTEKHAHERIFHDGHLSFKQ